MEYHLLNGKVFKMSKKIIIIGSGAIAKLHEKIIRKKYRKFSIERFSSREFSKISKASSVKIKFLIPIFYNMLTFNTTFQILWR